MSTSAFLRDFNITFFKNEKRKTNFLPVLQLKLAIAISLDMSKALKLCNGRRVGGGDEFGLPSLDVASFSTLELGPLTGVLEPHPVLHSISSSEHNNVSKSSVFTPKIEGCL